MSTSKIPPLLSPYLCLPPEASLILLTSVLGASTNWLVLRFLHATLLGGSENGVLGDAPESGADVKVVFVSFLRDGAFWKEGGRRLGVDLDKLGQRKRFVFVDGLSGLFLPGQKPKIGEKDRVLRSAEVESIEREIGDAILSLQDEGEGKVVLVIDGLDFLLASTSASSVEVGEMVLGLREQVQSTMLTLSADLPLVGSSQTPLEVNHAGLLLGQAHEADLSLCLRLLDSGVARDVSGVLRVTGGEGVEERELLYFVGGDGGVRVFERGS